MNEKIERRKEITARISKKHLILTPEGDEYIIDLPEIANGKKTLEKFGDASLASYIWSEELKNVPRKEPPSIDAMRKLQLIDYEPAADSGHFRFYPQGNLIYELLIDWANEIAIERLNAMKIETPLLYDWHQPDIREQGESFHERHYLVHVLYDKDKEWVLRFAGDFGLFRMVKDAQISYKHLPMRIYELSKSFRYEKRGELVGLRRLRGFTMPDIHSFCKDLEEGWTEFQELYKNYDDLAKGTGIEYAIVFRCVEDFYLNHKDKLVELLRYSQRPAFVELLSEMKHYWVIKHEFQGIDSVGGNCQLCTVQLDVKDAKVYGIKYTDIDGSEKGCIICHSSIGAIERWIYTILEKALKMEIPQYPLWLAPTQVRIIPVENNYLSFCKEICDILTKNRIRANIDDRNERVSKKIRYAEREWVPYILVVGKKEKESNIFVIRKRADKTQVQKSIDELINEIKNLVNGFPFRKLPMPIYLSKWPVFYHWGD
ncbi:MAG: threonine--tRNA ligase [Candidatus Micrarchaeaceae archaeon]